jgi:hypothetical protein
MILFMTHFFNKQGYNLALIINILINLWIQIFNNIDAVQSLGYFHMDCLWIKGRVLPNSYGLHSCASIPWETEHPLNLFPRLNQVGSSHFSCVFTCSIQMTIPVVFLCFAQANLTDSCVFHIHVFLNPAIRRGLK